MNAKHREIDAAIDASDLERVVRLLAAVPEGDVGALYRRWRRRIAEFRAPADQREPRELLALAAAVCAPGATSALDWITDMRRDPDPAGCACGPPGARDAVGGPPRSAGVGDA
ncbi:hypothetical protein [Actinomadura sp. HBU206391]|uniref:hypothetical protein n=1 Tax=Actinomadura sp. HBU206391 TaxID=2731692 RepID=UPI00164F48F0|nr:hypothetical protein [Actinomadura sp. HBU206391]MBC6463378.1 hypothetical protein [Actinomadura sp. HBU206391]